MKSNYYLDTAKTIKDLVHGYVELTNFELSIIDTAPFQRLKDIRQLTCQQVYPDARHTRFEHSLGVLHLTKLAIDYINKNKFVAEPADLNNCPKFIFNKSVSFNMKLAALLHDVGHCPFSHMGETQLNPLEIKEELYEQICERLLKCFYTYDIITLIKKLKPFIGVHYELYKKRLYIYKSR